MSEPHEVDLRRCVVCDGRGTLPAGFYSEATMLSDLTRETCRACNGTGVMNVNEILSNMRADRGSR